MAVAALLRLPRTGQTCRPALNSASANYTHNPLGVPMSQYPQAAFIKSANTPSQFVPDEGAEVAFAGRSNAGKSSAINVIVNRRQFARTSKTPGRTQLINFFSLHGDERLVDLPGYGFAKVSDRKRHHWGDLIADYFESRQSLKGLFLIMDIRRQMTDFDQQMLAFAEQGRAANARSADQDRQTEAWPGGQGPARGTPRSQERGDSAAFLGTESRRRRGTRESSTNF